MLVDDEPVILEGLKCALQEHDRLEVVAEARTGTEALGLLEKRPVDVVVVGDQLPDLSGVDLSVHAQQHVRPAAWVVRSSPAGPDPWAKGSLAATRVPKSASVTELVHVIRRVAARPRLGSSRATRRSLRIGWLSERERGVVEAVMRGRSNDEIGAELGVARKTVEACLTRLFKRFGIASRTELAIRAVRERWLDAGADRLSARLNCLAEGSEKRFRKRAHPRARSAPL
jgi:DNA-binding NarL/FixJ family response regulator